MRPCGRRIKSQSRPSAAVNAAKTACRPARFAPETDSRLSRAPAPIHASASMQTIDELAESIWKDLPFFRRQLLGRERVGDMVLIAIEQCPLDLCAHVSQGSKECEVLEAAWSQDIKRSYCLLYTGDEAKFGPLFWILVSPVLHYVIQRILEWYFESRANRTTLKRWKKGLTQ